MEPVFAYLAGLLTLINPCVLPVLPLAVSSGLEKNRAAPLALTAGMSLSFSVLGVGVAALGPALGLSPELVARFFAVLMILFGVVLLIPVLSARFALVTGSVADGAAKRLAGAGDQSIGGHFLGGALLGAVWTPCIGPTLGGAIALASQGAELWRATIIMLGFSAGVSTIIIAIAYGSAWLTPGARGAFYAASRWAKPLAGAAFFVIGFATLFGLTEIAIGAALDIMPAWLQDLSVSL
jgi:cytochrome c-type biogenesis protein